MFGKMPGGTPLQFSYAHILRVNGFMSDQTNLPNGPNALNNSVIQVTDFHKTYGGTQAVSQLSFEVGPGEILGLVGPNGAGKTTTMRSLSAIIAPTGGRLSVMGRDVVADPIGVKNILAYIPDDPQLFPNLTVEEHLAFIASAFAVEQAEVKANQLLEEFELTAKRRARARDLSRGMRQKLAICCAYLHDPAALLFDEPLTGLDPHGIHRLKASIRERAARGAAVLISSHLLAMVEDICTHLLILDSGRQRFFGTLQELKQRFQREEQNATLERIFFLATRAETETREPATV